MIDRETIERIMDTAKVEEVVGDFVSLRKRGVNMIGLCPFHNEKTPLLYGIAIKEPLEVLRMRKRRQACSLYNGARAAKLL